MRSFFFIVILLFTATTLAQQRVELQGEVTGRGELLENVHIGNVSSGKYSVSEKDGSFRLQVKVGDTLLFTHVAHKDLVKSIKEEDFLRKRLKIEMDPLANELDEVIVGEDRGITAMSVGIISEKKEKLSENERRLATAGDFKPVHLLGLLVGGLNVDAVLNSINGQTRNLKRNIEVEKRINNKIYLETNFSDFIKANVEPDEQEFQVFLDVVLDKPELQTLINKKDHEGLKFLLLDTWFDIQKK